MSQRQWWNGRWSRLVRRDVFVHDAADGRWRVELRRGGAGGRQRFRSFDSEDDAVGWVRAAVLADPGDGWREVGAAGAAGSGGAGKRPRAGGRKRAARSDSRGDRKVAQDLDLAG